MLRGVDEAKYRVQIIDGFSPSGRYKGHHCTHTDVGDISIIFPCSFAVGITQQYGIYVLLG